jgi:chromosome partitioning protein
VAVEAFGSAKHALSKARCDLLVIDAPARTSAGTLELAQAADLVVQPSGASLDDLRPCVREFLALQKKGIKPKKLVVALTRIATDYEAAAARDYLHEAGIVVLESYVPEQAAYRAAQNKGRALTETPYETLNQQAERLLQNVIDLIGGKR